MSKSRLSSSERASRVSVGLTDEKSRFLGLSLSGGKADKACLAVIDFYPKQQKVFLTKLFEKIKNEENYLADQKILDLISQHANGAVSLAFDVPWRLPLALRLEEPFYDRAPHLEWAKENLKKLNQKKKPKKIFCPYTQRCVELFLSYDLEEKFVINHAMGANTAPLLARAMYLQERIQIPSVEVHPKVALWRIGRSLNIMKSHLRFHRHSVGGDEARRAILEELTARDLIFIYEQDRRLMIENNHAFESFVCALTGFLKFKKRTEPRPEGFPIDEDWVEIPQASLPWGSL